MSDDPCAECLTCQTKLLGSLVNEPMHLLLVGMASAAIGHYVRVGVPPTTRGDLFEVISATLHFLETLDSDQSEMVVSLLNSEGVYFQPIEREDS